MTEEKQITAYQKISGIVDKVVTEAKKTIFGNIDSVSLIEKLQQYAPKIEEAYTTPLKQQTSQLIQTNEVNQKRISELEKNLQEIGDNYKTTKEKVLSAFSDTEIEESLNQRKQFNVPIEQT